MKRESSSNSLLCKSSFLSQCLSSLVVTNSEIDRNYYKGINPYSYNFKPLRGGDKRVNLIKIWESFGILDLNCLQETRLKVNSEREQDSPVEMGASNISRFKEMPFLKAKRHRAHSVVSGVRVKAYYKHKYGRHNTDKETPTHNTDKEATTHNTKQPATKLQREERRASGLSRVSLFICSGTSRNFGGEWMKCQKFAVVLCSVRRVLLVELAIQGLWAAARPGLPRNYDSLKKGIFPKQPFWLSVGNPQEYRESVAFDSSK
ncbi:hypothetical protein TNCV_5017931 [Trichonephila clavipes]|nr:hypothetical protein TNCV_5017931 [Trichonephila clavipes]